MSDEKRKLSEEHKRKIGLSSIGRTWTPERRAKFLKSVKERHYTHSEEVRKKLSNAKKGTKLSEETKNKMSNAAKGKKKTEEHTKNIRLGLKKLYAENKDLRDAVSIRRKGIVFSEEHRKHLSEAQLRRFSKEEEKNKLIDTWIKNIMAGASPRNFVSGHYNSEKAGKVHYRSSYELAFYKNLDKEDEVETYLVEPEFIKYEFEGKIKRYVPDVKVFYKNGEWKVFEIKPLGRLSQT